MKKNRVHTRRETGRPYNSIKPALLTLAIALNCLNCPIVSADSITQNGQPNGSNINCPVQTLYDPDSKRCVEQRDMTNMMSLDSKSPNSSIVPSLLDLRSKTTPQQQRLLSEIPPPGGIGAGIVYRNNELKALWSSKFYTKMFVHPNGLDPSAPIEWLFTTHTNRTEKGVEPVGIYRQLDPSSPGSGDFGIFDWSCSEQYPCSSGPGPAWQWTQSLSSFACNISQLIDQGGHSQQYMKLSNGTIKLDNSDPPLWTNQVHLWNFCDDLWDLIYEHEYRVYQKDCRSGTCGWWGPILETFGPMPEINELGFEESILYHDGLESLLATSETNFYQPISQWQLFHRHPNRSYGAGNFVVLNMNALTIEKLINHRGRETPNTAAQLLAGTRYRAEYKVTNNSPNRLYPVQVFEGGQLVCDLYALDPGESKQRYKCASNQTVLAGSNNVPATVTAKVSGSNQALADQTNAYYTGFSNVPGKLTVTHYVNERNADTQAKAVDVNGDEAEVLFRIENTGSIELYRVNTFHDPASPVNSGWQQKCFIGTLDPGQVRYCKRNISVTESGLNKAFGRAQGENANVSPTGFVNASNPTYFNVVLP